MDMYAFGIALHQLYIGELPWIPKMKELEPGKRNYAPIIREQEEISEKLSKIKKHKNDNFESAFTYIIYQLLDPNPATRMTIDQYLLAIRDLKKRFPQ